MNEELTKAQPPLIEAKKREEAQHLIPVRVAKNTTIMMSPKLTDKQIQAKIKQYRK